MASTGSFYLFRIFLKPLVTLSWGGKKLEPAFIISHRWSRASQAQHTRRRLKINIKKKKSGRSINKHGINISPNWSGHFVSSTVFLSLCFIYTECACESVITLIIMWADHALRSCGTTLAVCYPPKLSAARLVVHNLN